MTDTGRRVLAVEMGHNDADALTVRDYLVSLLTEVWREESHFSGKRPFGNSGWQDELLTPLIKMGLVEGALDEDGCVEWVNDGQANALILEAIRTLGEA